jgi:hypothetical protein
MSIQTSCMLYAYVGVGQFTNPKLDEEVAYQDALREARCGAQKPDPVEKPSGM